MAPNLPAGREENRLACAQAAHPTAVDSFGSMERTPRLSACRCFFFCRSGQEGRSGSEGTIAAKNRRALRRPLPTNLASLTGISER
jgi:hypothetical protein